MTIYAYFFFSMICQDKWRHLGVWFESLSGSFDNLAKKVQEELTRLRIGQLELVNTELKLTSPPFLFSPGICS